MVRLSSSLRHRDIAQTLRIAKAYAPKLGISRVTNTTALDRIGIPVFSSIRPTAVDGSLCVSAGKGLRPQEAEIGAYMEAIELAMCEYGRSGLDFSDHTTHEVLNSFDHSIEMRDFCPLLGQHFSENETLACTKAHDVDSGETRLLPSELVFLPFYMNPHASKFGSSSVGLASGNDVMEASVHALAEIIEHDVAAFDFVVNRSRLVDTRSAPESIQSLIKQCEDSQFEIFLRVTENEFNMPYFRAFLFEKNKHASLSVCLGYGLHPIREIAAIRALTEVVQSRLTHIHGGRDDLTKRVDYWTNKGRVSELQAIQLCREEMSDDSTAIDYDAIEDHSHQVHDVDSAWSCMRDALHSNGIERLARVVFTQESDPIQVIKLVVPKLESFCPEHTRIGKRLHDFIENA